jgi:hypothetical protein
MRTIFEKIKVGIMWVAIIILILILSPILSIVGLIIVTRALIIELTQEYRCMRCGKWIPEEKRVNGIINWCSKECYYDK